MQFARPITCLVMLVSAHAQDSDSLLQVKEATELQCGGCESGKNVHGNCIGRTNQEDEFALNIIEESGPKHSCGLGYILQLYGESHSSELGDTLQDRSAVPPSYAGKTCKWYTQSFLTNGMTVFKVVSDAYFAQHSANTDLVNDIRGAPLWDKEGKGRMKKPMRNPEQHQNPHCGISENPIPGCVNYFQNADGSPLILDHAKGIFQVDANSVPGKEYNRCDLPFVAGASGTLLIGFTFMIDKQAIRCNAEGAKRMMQFSAQLVLGGHHSWSEICPVLYYIATRCESDRHHSLSGLPASGKIGEGNPFKGLKCGISKQAQCVGDWCGQMQSLRNVWKRVQGVRFS